VRSVSDANLKRLIGYFQTLSPESVARIGEFYTEHAYFRDPFNEVRDIESLKHIFSDMFERLHEPRFVVTETIMQEHGAVLIWDFTFRMKSLKPDLPRRIHGLSHVKFADDGRVNYHRDYWDAAGELYEQFPFIGPVLRWLKRRAK
jgi:steroid Delta-isomerase